MRSDWWSSNSLNRETQGAQVPLGFYQRNNNMRNNLTALALCWCVLRVSAQTVPNGGFESWDSTFYTVDFPEIVPIHWMMWEINTPCFPPNIRASPFLSSQTGCCSVKLESTTCVSAGNSRLEEGFIHSGNVGQYPPLDWSVPWGGRPNYLNFYYMFHPEGNDSAYVRILLFNYDSITPGLSSVERKDTVAFSSGYMHQEATSFTPYSLPIQYLSADTPAFMHIYFSTSKTLAENHGNTPPYLYAYPGTTLWIDDVNVSGGPMGIGEEARQSVLEIFPNPGNDHLHFSGIAGEGAMWVSVFDPRGSLVLDTRLLDPNEGLDVSNLFSGFYTIRIRSRQGKFIQAKWVKE